MESDYGWLSLVHHTLGNNPFGQYHANGSYTLRENIRATNGFAEKHHIRLNTPVHHTDTSLKVALLMNQLTR